MFRAVPAGRFLTRSFCATTRWHLEPHATAVSLSVAPSECSCNIQTSLLSHIYTIRSLGNAHFSNTPRHKTLLGTSARAFPQSCLTRGCQALTWQGRKSSLAVARRPHPLLPSALGLYRRLYRARTHGGRRRGCGSSSDPGRPGRCGSGGRRVRSPSSR